MFDVLIVGGSVAGLSAATYWGRMRRQVLVIDSGQPCNRYTLHFADGSTLARHALFINLRTGQHSNLVATLGCEINAMGFVQADTQGRTTVAGVYAAGDMTSPLRAVVFSAAQGAAAGIWLNMELMAGSAPH